MKEIRKDSRGNTLYVEETELGPIYWSDEVGGGVCVWVTALVSPEAMRIALADWDHREHLARLQALEKPPQ